MPVRSFTLRFERNLHSAGTAANGAWNGRSWPHDAILKRDGFKSNRHHALAYC
jgi:hypothetical protein